MKHVVLDDAMARIRESAREKVDLFRARDALAADFLSTSGLADSANCTDKEQIEERSLSSGSLLDGVATGRRDLVQTIKALQNEVETLKVREASLYASTSWRVTAPLRAVRKLFSRS